MKSPNCSNCSSMRRGGYTLTALLLTAGGFGYVSASQHASENRAWQTIFRGAVADKNAANLRATRSEDKARSLADELAATYVKNGKANRLCQQLQGDLRLRVARIDQIEGEKQDALRLNHTLSTKLDIARQQCTVLSDRVTAASTQLTQTENLLASERNASADQVASVRKEADRVSQQLAGVQKDLAKQTQELVKTQSALALVVSPTGPTASTEAIPSATARTVSYRKSSTTSNIEPFYIRDAAQAAGTAGNARFAVEVGTDCRVLSVKLLQSSGDTLHDAELQQSLEQSLWRSRAGSSLSQPTEVEVQIKPSRAIVVRSI